MMFSEKCKEVFGMEFSTLLWKIVPLVADHKCGVDRWFLSNNCPMEAKGGCRCTWDAMDILRPLFQRDRP